MKLFSGLKAKVSGQLVGGPDKMPNKANISSGISDQVPPPMMGGISAETVAMAIPRSMFDEHAYLSANPDVAAAVLAGHTGAYEHYTTYGHKEEMSGARTRSIPQMSSPLGVSVPDRNSLIDRIIHLETEKQALLEGWDAQLPAIEKISFDMLSEDVDDAVVPPLDKSNCDESNLDADQSFWRDNGYLIKEKFIPDDLIDRYCELRARHPSVGGWSCPVPYMYVEELRDISLYKPTMEMMEKLIGEEMGLHLNLTGWVSTDRNWHQDDYLNPPYINSWYCAVWVALEDIHPDCGPFEFVPGSHKWPLMKSHKVRMFLKAEERNDIGWPSIAERFVNDVAEEEIGKRQLPRQKFIAKKGDVLFWHGRLMHRGSYANVPGMERKTLISHYSGISHRVDMPVYQCDKNGKIYFVHDLPLDWNPYG